MQTVTTIGLDIAKSVFQVHGVDTEGNVVIRRQLKRRYVMTFFQKLPPWALWNVVRVAASFRLDVREFDDLGPLLGLCGDEGAKFGDRHWRRHASERDEMGF